MHNFVWQDSYNVDDPAIDGQHRRLFDLANGLLYAGNAADLTDAMSQLHDYVRVHFGAEEHLMRRVGYPAFQAHSRMHRALTRRLGDLAALVAGGGSPHDDLQAFMHQWLVGHIVEQDKRLADFLRGLARPTNG
jgi:hemerythrin